VAAVPTLTGITIFPVKSLDGLSLTEATVLPSGALAGDRRWRLVDAEGRVVNAKRTARFHLIRAEFDLADGGMGWGDGPPPGGNFISLSLDEAAGGDSPPSLAPEVFPLVPGRDGPCGWLSEALAEDVFLQERAEGGFPDDREAPGPTLISTESLTEVARWFGWEVDEARRRFRMNLEAVGDDGMTDDASKASGKACNPPFAREQGQGRTLAGPFWEDVLVCPARPLPALTDVAAAAADPYTDLPPPEPQRFMIGQAQFHATGICRRCVVPSRHSRTGLPTVLFQDAFEARRSRGLRVDVDGRAWDGYFRLGVNTAAEVAGATSLCLGEAFSGGPLQLS
jgi:uncharacterized protein YcbX